MARKTERHSRAHSRVLFWHGTLNRYSLFEVDGKRVVVKLEVLGYSPCRNARNERVAVCISTFSAVKASKHLFRESLLSLSLSLLSAHLPLFPSLPDARVMHQIAPPRKNSSKKPETNLFFQYRGIKEARESRFTRF